MARLFWYALLAGFPFLFSIGLDLLAGSPFSFSIGLEAWFYFPALSSLFLLQTRLINRSRLTQAAMCLILIVGLFSLVGCWIASSVGIHEWGPRLAIALSFGV